MAGLNARRAAGVLADDVKVFERLGYQPLEHGSSFAATLDAPNGGRRLVLRLHREGRGFGGNWALEITTAEPVLPASGRGLSGRGRGVVRQRGASLVWSASPPVRRATPLPPGQPEAIVAALEAFARAGERLR